MAGHIVILPFSKETNNEVSSELSSEDLGEEVDVGNECCLEDDWDVGGIEQFDWIWLLESSHLSAAQTQFNSETLEVNNNEHYYGGGNEVAEIWCILPVKRLLQAIYFVWLSQKEVEGGNNGSLKFSTLVSSNGNW